MSRFIPTKLGLFRAVKDGTETTFLFECPKCREWLPMDEEILAGTKPIDHEYRKEARFCSYIGTREYGKWLVATMQARALMGEEGIRPYETDEDAARRQCMEAHHLYCDDAPTGATE